MVRARTDDRVMESRAACQGVFRGGKGAWCRFQMRRRQRLQVSIVILREPRSLKRSVGVSRREEQIADCYPIVLTRNLEDAKRWLSVG
jgi:hypothetical protein